MPVTSLRSPPKRKLTVVQATEVWVETTRALEGLKGLRNEAAAVILAHAERTGKRTYADKIAVQPSGGSLILD